MRWIFGDLSLVYERRRGYRSRCIALHFNWMQWLSSAVTSELKLVLDHRELDENLLKGLLRSPELILNLLIMTRSLLFEHPQFYDNLQ